MRNVTCCPVPATHGVRAATQTVARRISDHLLPHTGAYHEIWLDGEKIDAGQPPGASEESIYGTAYLPRKFKIGVAPPGDNCIDVYTQDIGLVAVVQDAALQGFNVLVGGGLGMTHNKPRTFPRLTDPLVEVCQMKESLTLDSMQESLHPLRKRVVEHAVYRHIETLADVCIFMEHHVFAVWDFMSLLKALQRQLTCVTVPWMPQGDRLSRRLINELVLAEESDEGCGGECSSHFELYRAAMDQCGADTSRIDDFLDRVRWGEGMAEALEKAEVPKAARAFVEITWKLVESGAVHAIAAAFALGREELIPEMFRALVVDLQTRFPGQLTLLHNYLERHIRVDEERHTPMALLMLARLCNDDPRKWREAEEAARVALNARLALWDGVTERIALARGKGLLGTTDR